MLKQICKKWSLSLSMILVFLMTMAATPAVAELPDILKSGKIRIAVPENFPPFGSLGEEGEYVGYDVEIAQMIADDLGVELELVPVTSKQRIPFLETDRVDLVVSVMGANPERAKSICQARRRIGFCERILWKKGGGDRWNTGRLGDQRKCSCRR